MRRQQLPRTGQQRHVVVVAPGAQLCVATSVGGSCWTVCEQHAVLTCCAITQRVTVCMTLCVCV